MMKPMLGCKQQCDFDGCDRARSYALLCKQHYKQQWLGQDLRPIRNASGIVDFEEFMVRTEPSGDCLRWVSSKTVGYANCWYKGAPWKAHRLAYHLSNGEDISNRPIHHKCANKWCVKPEHLQLATTAENTLEMNARKGYEAEIAMLKVQVTELKSRLSKYEEV